MGPEVEWCDNWPAELFLCSFWCAASKADKKGLVSVRGEPGENDDTLVGDAGVPMLPWLKLPIEDVLFFLPMKSSSDWLNRSPDLELGGSAPLLVPGEVLLSLLNDDGVGLTRPGGRTPASNSKPGEPGERLQGVPLLLPVTLCLLFRLFLSHEFNICDWVRVLVCGLPCRRGCCCCCCSSSCWYCFRPRLPLPVMLMFL